MSIEVTLVTALLSSVLGSGALAESLIEIFKKGFKERASDDAGEGALTSQVSDRKAAYLTSQKASEIATDAALQALDLTYQTGSSIRDERMRQARLTFNVALGLMTAGVLIVFTGAAMLWFRDNIAPGLITITAGAVSEIVSALVFALNRETNNRLEDVRKDLSRIEAARIGLSMAKQISDLEKRDGAIVELTMRLQSNG
ncbi:MAG: hypothetical protein JWQ90_4775 [Hydrocarboniphaga sp.]|uniref:TRADD-N-associated membrane domain-containing protein n=1 Tax=Hydrocarboniphaga sp. TaxID=2033016 RepID=UPI00260BD9D9|nr:hypothetical protein [Hydrocarboniphaga sp.]MDB5972325.1 hypothetical protein [Hydrocarboniphaga sp.]